MNYEVDNSKPLLLRPHHIRSFRILVVGMKVSTIDEEFTGITERANGYAEMMKDCTIEDYRRDVIGETEADIASYKQGLINAALEFHFSADTRVVQLKAGVKDMICNACVVGNHCTRLSPGGSSFEQLCIDEFFNYAKVEAGSLDRIRVERDPIKRPNGLRRVVITDVGTLKRIFRNPFMDNRL